MYLCMYVRDLFLQTSNCNITAVTDPICLKFTNCHGNICPGNICPCDICPYQLLHRRQSICLNLKPIPWISNLNLVPKICLFFSLLSLTSRPSYGDSYKSHYRAKFVPDCSGWPILCRFAPLSHCLACWASFGAFGPSLVQFGLVWLYLAPFKKRFFCIGILPHTTLGSIFSVNPFSWPNKITLWFTILYKKYKIWPRDVLLRS